MRTLLIAFLMTLATQAGAECGKLCDYEWWEKATTADLKAELEAGADVKARHVSGYTPLHFAAITYGTPESIQVLIEAGADIMARTKTGWTPLHTWAGLRGFVAHTIKAFLDAGADVEARNLSGWTPLHIAAYIGSPESVQILLEAGADANAKNEDGSTPWDLAQDNEILKGTKGYWALNDARFN